MGNTKSPKIAVGFLDQSYRYKSVATQIPHDGDFVPIPYSDQKFHPSPGDQTSVASRCTNSKHGSLIRMT